MLILKREKLDLTIFIHKRWKLFGSFASDMTKKMRQGFARIKRLGSPSGGVLIIILV